jgi:hypothetical protein
MLHAVSAAPIDSNNKYAWSNQEGWINFNPINGDVNVTSTGVT